MLPEAAIADLHRFPKGPAAGTFLHGILEWAAGEGFARVAADSALLEQYLAPRCRHGQWQPWRELLGRWLQRVLTTPLPLDAAQPLRLCDLSRVRAELEFWFSVSSVRVSRVERLLRRYLLPGQAPAGPGRGPDERHAERVYRPGI